MNKQDIKNLALDDLKRSGLNGADFLKMKLAVCDEDQASAVLNSTFATAGYALPYFDVAGKLIDSVRFRFLLELNNKEGNAVKYSQPKGTEPRLYFPPCIKWRKLLKDTSITITFTEGEKKAYKACKEGIPTIGLGGVWSFKCKRLRKNLIDDFKHITLKDRKVLLCFDSDAHTNNEVMKALRAFARELNNEGAVVLNKKLPFNPYQKIGLDDYLLDHKLKDYEALPEDMFDELSDLDDLNNEIAYIKSLGKVYILDDNLFVGSDTLTKMVYSHRTSMGDNGNPVSIAQQWLHWPNRRTHRYMVYEPGKPETTQSNDYNLWKGWGCSPKPGSIKPFLSVVNQLFDNDQMLIQWFLDWVAYPIQHPGAKMLSAVLLQSIEHGTGKSSIGEAVGSMYGKNFSKVESDQLKSLHNEWAINKQFILGDEILGSERRAESDRIKNMVTRTEVNINKKYQPTYDTVDCINYIFTSNHPDALSIEPDDRRFFVYKVKRGNGISLAQGKVLEAFRKGNGKSYLLHYFINDYQITKGFDHRARPPMTDAKYDLIDNSLTDIERFLTHVKMNPEHALAIDGVPIDRDLFTVPQIIHLYQRAHPGHNVTTTAMGKAINKILDEGEVLTVRTQTGTYRLRVMRNFHKWEKASHNDMRLHYDRSKIALFDVAKKRKHKGGKVK